MFAFQRFTSFLKPLSPSCFIFKALIVSACIMLTACKDAPKKQSQPKKTKAVPVEVVTVNTGVIRSYIHSYANIEALSAVDVNARIAELVKVIHVEEGDIVAKGDKLLTLQNDEQRIALNKISATLDKNQQDLDRQEHLKSRNLVSGKEYANAKNLVKQSILDKQSAQLNYDYTFVTAPIAGTVTERHVNVGNNVRVSDKLVSLVDFNSLVALVYLPQDTLADIKVDQPAVITTEALDGQSFSGRVLRISPIIDPRSGTYKVTVAIDTHRFLRPGMYVKVSLKIQEKNNAVLIPKSAVVVSDEQTYVYRVNNATATRVAIQTDITDIDYISPKNGINKGDRLIIAGQNNLKDNALVRVVNQSDMHDLPITDGLSAKPKPDKTASEKTPLNVPIKQEGESRKAFRQRIRDYAQSLPDDERNAFLATRKKQRAQHKSDQEKSDQKKQGEP